MDHPFRNVDVFAATPFHGNPLAVVHDADGLTTDAMQRITRWMNLSETVFLLPPTSDDADYRVRIFTLAGELPFAGHPTLGACHAWLERGGVPRDGDVVQECGVGLVRLRRGSGRIAFAAPPIDGFVRYGPVSDDELDRIVAALRIDRDRVVDAHWVDNGPGWAAVLLGSVDEVLDVDSVATHHDKLDIGVVGPHPAGSEYAFEVRGLFSDHQGRLIEDPVTGSLNASVAQWLLASGRASAPYLARQGTRLGREGRVHVDRDDTGQVWIGGQVSTIVEGRIRT